MKNWCRALLACAALTACEGKSASPDATIKASIDSGAVRSDTTKPSADTRVALPAGLIAQMRTLTFCSINYEGSDAFEGNATPTVTDDGTVTGLNVLLQLAASAGAGTISDATVSKNGFTFNLRFSDGKSYKGDLNTTYGSTALSLDIGSESKYLVCLDHAPEEP